MDGMPWRSRFVFGSDEWTTEIAVRPWDRRVPSVGGRLDPAAQGVLPATYVVRRRHVLLVTLRIDEAEWGNLLDLLEYAQAPIQVFTWYPDADDDAVSFDVWLDSPQVGEEVSPTRDQQYEPLLEVTLGLVQESNARWDLEYFPLVQAGAGS